MRRSDNNFLFKVTLYFQHQTTQNFQFPQFLYVKFLLHVTSKMRQMHLGKESPYTKHSCNSGFHILISFELKHLSILSNDSADKQNHHPLNEKSVVITSAEALGPLTFSIDLFSID